MNPELIGRLQLFREEALNRGLASEDVERWIATARPYPPRRTLRSC